MEKLDKIIEKNKYFDANHPSDIMELNSLIITASLNQQNCINEHLRQFGLKLTASNILFHIMKNGGFSTQKELSKSISLSKQALTLSVNTLEELGFLYRESSSLDRRLRKICITEKGLDFLMQDISRYNFISGICEIVSQEEASIVIDVLKRLNIYYKQFSDDV